MKAIYGMNIILLIRSTYICPRSSAEEFRVQLPERSIEDAQAYAEQLLADIGITDFCLAWSRALRR